MTGEFASSAIFIIKNLLDFKISEPYSKNVKANTSEVYNLTLVGAQGQLEISARCAHATSINWSIVYVIFGFHTSTFTAFSKY